MDWFLYDSVLRHQGIKYRNTRSNVVVYIKNLQNSKKWSFQLRVSSVTINKFAGNFKFVYIYHKNP